MWYRHLEGPPRRCRASDGERFVVARTGTGLDELRTPLKVVKPNLIVLEAIAKAIGQRAKTDPIDAGAIAHFGEATGIGRPTRCNTHTGAIAHSKIAAPVEQSPP